jgi:hypothetical protein
MVPQRIAARGLMLLLLTVAAAEVSPGEAASDARYRGRPLQRALHDLRERGLVLLFSTVTVRPDMRVASEPSANEPRAILEQLLAPHGLRAVTGAGGALVVVVAAPASVPMGTLRGDVRSSGRDALDEVVVRVWTSAPSPAPDLPAAAGASQASRTAVEVEEDGVVTVRTAANGRFEIDALPPGSYAIEVEHTGYLSLRQDGLLVVPGAATEVRVELQPAPFLHEEMLVSSSRLGALQDAPSSPLALSRAAVEALPQFGGDVFRALTLFPGSVANDNTAQFSLHGGRRDEVQILLDGQELYDAFHLRDFDNALSVVAADTLSDVALQTGAFAAPFGDRMGGVLELRSESPSARRRHRLGLSLLNAQITTGGPSRGGGGAWLVSARRGAVDLATRIFGKEDPAFWDAFGKVESGIGRRHRLSGHALFAGDRLRFEESVDDETKSFDTSYDSSYLWLVHQAFAPGVAGGAVLETRASWSGLERDRLGIEDEEDLEFEVVDRRDVEVVELEHSWSIELAGSHLLRWGLGARHYRSHYDYRNRVDRTRLAPSELFEPRAETSAFVDRIEGDHRFAYVSDRFTPVERLVAEVGVRFDRHPLTGDDPLSPRLNLAWRAGDTIVLRAGWGHYFQSQRPHELQIEDGESRFSAAERSEHRVLGYEQSFPAGDAAAAGWRVEALRVELYSRRVERPRERYENLFEPINTFPEIEPDRVRLRPEEARAQGVELVLRGALGEGSDWWLSYALSRAEDRIAQRWIKRSRDQTHALNLAFNRRLSRAWQLDLAWRYHTGWPTSPVSLAVSEPEAEGEDEAEWLLIVGQLNSERLAPYHRLDLRLSRSWQLRRGRVRAYLDVQNLYDRENVAGFDLEVDEELEGPVLTKAPERWAGIFPSFGIVWDF